MEITYVECGFLSVNQVESIIKESQFVHEGLTYIKTRLSLFEYRFIIKGNKKGVRFLHELFNKMSN